MDARLATGLVAGVLLLGLYWVEAQSESAFGFPEEYAAGPEAREWLLKSNNESALASNRFGPTSSALLFVRQLYGAGAVRVIVPQACITKDEVEVYADALVVTLPADPAKRGQVWRLCAPELARQGAKPPETPDAKEDRVFLWWD
jgi:hypothetical protein